MVAVVERTAVQPFKVKDGDKQFDLKVGKSYDTAKNLSPEGEVFVFSNYWLWVPAECFGMGPKEQRQAMLETADEKLRVASAKLRKAIAELDAAERDQRTASEEIERLRA